MSISATNQRQFKLFSQQDMKTETYTLQKTVEAQAARIVQQESIIKQRDSKIFHLECLLEERGLDSAMLEKYQGAVSETNALRRECEALKRELDEKNETVSRLLARTSLNESFEDTIQVQRERIDELNEQLRNSQRVINEHSSLGEVGNLLEEIGDPAAKTSARSDQESELIQNKAGDDRKRFEAQIEQLRSEVTRLEEEGEDRKQSEEREVDAIEHYQKQQRIYEAEIRSLRQQLTERENAVERQNEERDGERDMCASLEQDIAHLATELDERTRQMFELQREQQETAQRNAELEETRKIEVQQLVNEINEEKEVHAEAIDSAQRNAERLQQSNVQLAQENVRLQFENQQQSQRIEGISAQYNEVLADNKVISASLANLEESRLQEDDCVESAFERKKALIVTLEQELLEQELQLTRTAQMCRNVQNGLSEAARQPMLEQAVIEHSRQLAKQCFDTHGDLEISQANSESLTQQIGEYAAALAAANRQIMDMFTEIRGLREEHTRLKMIQIEGDQRLKTSELINQELEMRLSTTE